MRLFVSVDLPDAVARVIGDVQDPLRDVKGLKLVAPEQAHVTLKFLGDVDEDRVPEVEEAIETAVDAAGVEPFETTVAGLGVFPTLDYVTVVWAGIGEGGDEMTRLHEALERELRAIGFDPEDHDFTPHATIGRLTDARGKEQVVETVTGDQPTFGRFRVEHIRLTESTLTREGPEYATVTRFDL